MKPTSIYVAIVSSNRADRRQVNCFVNRPSKAALANLADDAEILRVVSQADEWPAIGVTTVGSGDIEILRVTGLGERGMTFMQ